MKQKNIKANLQWVRAFLLLVLFNTHIKAQKQNDYWYLGRNGFVTFEGDTANYKPLHYYNTNQNSSSSIADKQGNLLLYADYSNIFNKSGVSINNEINLFESVYSQSIVLIVPSIKDTNVYYVIKSNKNTMYYHHVDVNLNTIVGIKDTVFVDGDDKILQEMAATGSSNCSGIWLLNANNISTLFVNKIDKNQKIRNIRKIDLNTRFLGYPFKFSPSGKLFAYISRPEQYSGFDTLILCAFDQAKGTLKILRKYNLKYNAYTWANTKYIEFSKNEKFIYMIQWSGSTNIRQLNLATAQVETLKTLNYSMGLKLAPNGNIYFITKLENGNDYSSLGVILHADSVYPKCKIKENLFFNPYKSYAFGAFPNQVQNYFGRKYDFKITQTCIGDSVLYEGPKMADDDKYRWHFSDGFTSTLAGIKRPIAASQPIHLEYNYCDVYDTAKVFPIETKPISTLPKVPVIACGDTSFNYPFIGNNLHYQWNTGDTLSRVIVTSAGAYFVRVSNFCYQTQDSLLVQIIETTPGINLSAEYLTCENTPLILQNSVAGANYLWSNGATTSGVSLLNEGSYTLTVSNACRDSTLAFVVKQIKTSLYTPIADTTLCGVRILPVALNVPASSYYLNGKQVTNLLLTNNGKNFLEVENKCFTLIDTFNVNIINREARPFGTDTAICEQLQVVLQAGNTSNSYTWSSGSTTQNETITKNGDYYVTRRNACYSDSFAITVKFVPPFDAKTVANVFTPNGDGINELWLPLSEPVANYSLQVFNRWGVEVFATNNQNAPWDAKEATDGLYYYNISFSICQNQQKTTKGYVQVLR